MFLKIVGALSFLIVASVDCFGCMCGTISVCDAYSSADAVVIAEVTGYKPIDIPLDRIFVGGDPKKSEPGQEVRLKISKSFKGGAEKTIKLTQPNSTCDWSFDKRNLNIEYLFYLSYNKIHDEYSVISCGRSAEAKKAYDDMSWLNGLPESLNRTRISGLTKISDGVFSSVGNVTINIKGKKDSYSLTTNKNGLYEKWDIPPGRYRVTSQNPTSMFLNWTTSVPDNWTYFWSHGDADLNALDVTIEQGRCGGVDFMFKKK